MALNQLKFDQLETGSVYPITASYALSSSAGSGGTTLITGSTYPITSSWSNYSISSSNSVSSSYSFNSSTSSFSFNSTSASYSSTASVALNALTASYLDPISQSLIPSTGSVYSLGSPTNKWKDLYVSTGSIYIGDTVLSTSGSTLFANASPVVTLNTASGQIEVSGITASLSASYATNATLFNNTSSTVFATTGSNTFNGNITVIGSLIAQQYVVSSSVSYFTSSNFDGSTKFGDTESDTHQFTGSLRSPNITGSLLGTSSIALIALTSSYINVATNAVSSSFANTASVSVSSSFASTSSYNLNSISSSYSLNSVSSSYSNVANTATSATSANTATSSSYATTAGTATSATSATSANSATSASYALTASFALNASGGGGSGTVSGSANYISKFTSGTAVGNSVIYETGSNIGIGTINPNAKLNINSSGSLVSGSVVFSVEGTQGSLFSVDDSLSGSLMSVNDISGLPILEVFSDDRLVVGTYNANTLVVTGSRVGIGTSVPVAKLQVSGNISASSFTSSVSSGVGFLGTSSFASTASFSLTASNVVTASYALNALTASFALNASGGGGGGSGTVTGSVNYISKFTTTTTVGNSVIYETGSNIGIGTTIPNSKLNINSSGSLASGSVVFSVEGTQGSLFSVDDSLSGSLMSVNDISGLPILEVFSDDRLVVGTYNSNALVVTGSRVGIGINNPVAKLQVNGNISGSSFTGSVFGTSSWATNALSASYAPGGGTTLTTGSTYPITSSWAATSSNIIGGTSNYIPLWSTNTSLGNSVLYQNSSNIGIGTTSPADKLQVAAGNISVDSGYRYYMDANIGAASIRKSGSSMVFSVGSSDRVFIDSNGGVGIGTSFAASKLDVVDDLNGGHQILVRNINAGSSAYAALILKRNADVNGLVLFTNSSARTADGGAGNSTIRTDTGKLLLGAAGTTYHAIDTNGNVGISTTSPSQKLHLYNGNQYIQGTQGGGVAVNFTSFSRLIFNTDHSDTNKGPNKITLFDDGGSWVAGFGIHNSAVGYYSGDNHIWYKSTSQTASSEYMRLDTNGNIGIGTSSPNSRLTALGDGSVNSYSGVIRVSDTAGAKWAAIGLPDTQTGTTSANNYYLIGRGAAYTDRVLSLHIPNAADYGSGVQPKVGIYSTGTDLLFSAEASTGTIYVKGNVGIGTTSPVAKLQVNGNISGSSFTGSVFGTSSWANNATTASFASTASYNLNSISSSYSLTASFALNGGGGGTTLTTGSTYPITSSWATNVITASYALNSAGGGGGSVQTGNIANQTILYNVTTSQDNVISGLNLTGNKWGVTVVEEWNSGSIVGDEYYNSCSLLMHFSGSNGSTTTFIDNSPNNLTTTSNNGASISTVQSKFGGSSLLLDGTNDYLSIPSNAVFNLTGDYTIEFWAYSSNFAAGNMGYLHRGFYNTGTGTWSGLSFSIRGLGTLIRFYFYATTNLNEQKIDVSLPSNNAWHHFAMVKSGTTGTVYVDGTLAGTITSLNTPAASSETLRIGVWDYSAASEYFNGYIDEIRITKGIARYTGSFTPTTSEFPNNLNVTQLQTKYIGLVGGLNDSTVDYGVEKLSDSSLKIRKMTASGQPLSGSGTLSASVDRVYVNVLDYTNVMVTSSYALTASYVLGGIQTGSISNQTILYNVTTSQDNTITGLDLSGNKWDVSVIEEWNSASVAGDTYYSSCSLLMHFSGSNGSTTFTDNSPVTKSFTVNGNSQISTAQSKFGSSSAYFDGTGDYLSTNSSNDFAFGTGDFTIECWFYSSNVGSKGLFQTSDTVGGLKTSYTSGIILIQGANNVGAGLSGGLCAAVTGTLLGSTTAVITTNTWYHIALVRYSGTSTIYLNGTSIGSASTTGNCSGTYLAIGGYYDTSYLYQGYIDELRITKGVARYTGSFVTQSTAFLDSQNLNQLQTKYVGLVGGINDSNVDYGVEKLSDGSLKIRKMSDTGQPLSGSGQLSASVDRVYVNVLNYKEVQTTAQSASYAVSASYLINAASGESFHPFLLG